MAEAHSVDLTMSGPEARCRGQLSIDRASACRIIGPTQAAARLEGSKIFAKRLFERTGIPTARSSKFLLIMKPSLL